MATKKRTPKEVFDWLTSQITLMDKQGLHELLVLVRVRKDWPADDAMDLLGAGLMNLIATQKLKRRKEDDPSLNAAVVRDYEYLTAGELSRKYKRSVPAIMGVINRHRKKKKS